MTVQQFDGLPWENIIKLRVVYKGKDREAIHYCRTDKLIGIAREKTFGHEWVSYKDVQL